MKIAKYEIDMLNVKLADAFFIHFYDDGNGKDVNKRTVRNKDILHCFPL